MPDVIVGADGKARCRWSTSAEDYIAYHDKEWGFPVTDDYRLFEKLCLEGFQAGLSWLTILRKREAFRKAFAGFDYAKMARFDEKHVEKLLQNAGIIRHRGKIEAVIHNARQAREVKKEFGSLARYVWQYEPATRQEPAGLSTSPESIAMSKDLKRRGWRFVGPTTVYAFMQAMGLVNDHAPACFCHSLARRARRDMMPMP